MSAVGNPALDGSPGVMSKVLLRSSTPASNEKVLHYLEGMQSDPPNLSDINTPPPRSPRSLVSHPTRVTSPQMKGSASLDNARPPLRASRSGQSEISYLTDKGVNGVNGDGKSAHNEDLRSDIQEGRDSELGTTIPINVMMTHIEPGPEDGPGIRYESLGSSFGNFGKLPWDSQATPAKAAAVPLPVSAPPSVHPSDHNPFQSFGMTPVMGGAFNSSRPPVSPPPTYSTTNSNGNGPVSGIRSQTDSKLHPSPPSAALSRENSNEQRSPTGKEDVQRPWSPRSAQSRATQKSRGTSRYPPLPESQVEEESQVGPLPSMPPKFRIHAPSRAPSKASSLTPDDSPSVAGDKYAHRNISSSKEPSIKSPRTVQPPLMNVEHSEDRPMSPRSQRSRAMSPGGNVNVPTAQDLMQVIMPRSLPSQPNLVNGMQHGSAHDNDETPNRSQAMSPSDELDEEEEEMVRTVLSRTPRTSYAPSALEPEVQDSHFHDMELCELLHALDGPSLPEVVKRAVRKAVRTRVKKLGMKYDNKSLRQYRKSFHDHDPRVHLQSNFVPTISEQQEQQEPPEWAKGLMDGMAQMQQRLDVMAPKIERMKLSRTGSVVATRYPNGRNTPSEMDDNEHTPRTQKIPIYSQLTGTIADESAYQPDTGVLDPSTIPGEGEFEDDENQYLQQESETHAHGLADDFMAGARNESPGRQYLEEELYKLRVKGGGSQSAVGTHKTWEVAREDGDYNDYEPQQAATESGIPEITDNTNQEYTEHRQGSPSLPQFPRSESGGEMVHMSVPNPWSPGGYGEIQSPPWQRIHQCLLKWAIIWPMSELDQALNSTTRGYQVDEIALSIWSTQSYKRYVRSKMTDSPLGRVDRLFVPPNVADAISTAVFNGRHADACMMLRDLWAPFGLEGIPRLLIVLAKHRTDENHWVVHRFSLPDGQLTTYDTYPEKCLPDGRPLGWWFAIRIAWPDANYPSPDNLMQKMVRLHRPLQLGIDNSVAAAGIWRNLLMGSRAERSVDLERLRDLINTEVKNLRQRKTLGKLSIGQPKPTWEDMA